MFSVTWTAKNDFPLCTSKFNPTKSGVIVDRRDQVRMGRREDYFTAVSILSISFGSA